jgi:hypothetical protein
MLHHILDAFIVPRLEYSLYKPLEYAFEKNCQAPPHQRDTMRVRSRRTN